MNSINAQIIDGQFDESTNSFLSAQRKFWIGEFRSDGLALISQNGLFGAMDLSGQIKFSPKYDRIGIFDNDLGVVTLDGKYGLVSINGMEVLEPKYFYISDFNEGYSWCKEKKNGEWKLIDKSGNILEGYSYSTVSNFEQNYATVIDTNDVILVLSSELKVVYSVHSEEILPFWKQLFPDNYWISHRQNDHVQHSNLIGSDLINETVSSVFRCNDNMLIIPKVKEGKLSFQYLNTTKKRKSKCYDFAFPFKSGIAKVCNSKQWGIIDKKGKFIVPAEFEDIKVVSQSTFAVKSNGKFGVIDLQGNYIIQPDYMNCKPLNERFIAIRKYNDTIVNILSNLPNLSGFTDYGKLSNWGVLDLITKEIVVSFNYNEIALIEGELILGVNYERFKKKETIAGMELSSEDYSSNVSVISQEFNVRCLLDLFDLKSPLGTPVHQSSYSKSTFFNRTALYNDALSINVYYESSEFIMLPKDNLLIPIFNKNTQKAIKKPEYYSRDFFNLPKLKVVKENDNYGVTFKEYQILPSVFSSIKVSSSGIVVRNSNEKFGFFDLLGAQLIDFEFDQIREDKIGLLQVRKDGRNYTVNTAGNKIKN
ncbi:MAG: hypothetical protein ACJA1C_000930 [Crocinitomicaceae bacterium]|jgi:hypothetical protein